MGDAAGPDRRRVVGIVVGLVAAWVWTVVWWVGPGFNPTDDGLIVGQAARILHGDVPHVDFATPRPAGSAILHVVDVLLPTPLLATSRAIVLAELLLTALFTTMLVVRRSVRHWGPGEVGVVALGAVVSLHTFPLMSWHTIDGLLLTAAALVVTRAAIARRSMRWGVVAALLAGFAPIVKQSFAATPPLVLACAAWWWFEQPRGQRALRLRPALALVVALGAPGLLYLVRVAAAGGVSRAVDQMLGTQSVSVTAGVWRLPPGRLGLSVVAALVVAAGLAVARFVGPSSWRERVAPATAAVVASALAVGTVIVVVVGRLGLSGTWGAKVWWFAAATVAVDSAVRWRPDVEGAAVVALGWMATLSWGYAVPNLIAGSLVGLVVVRAAGLIADALPAPARRPGAIGAAAVGLALGVVALGLAVPERRDHVYRDVATSAQTASLGSVTSELRGVTTNPSTAAYLAQIRDCLGEFPADRLAVVPDNPGVPALFDRVNPLPVDWWYSLELPDDPEDRAGLVDDVRASAADGDYLVLFQTTSADGLATGGPPPDATRSTPLFDYSGGMAQDVFDALDGRTVTCGSFVGRYRPAS